MEKPERHTARDSCVTSTDGHYRSVQNRHRLRARAFVIGALLIPLNSYWVVQMEKVRGGPFPTTISLFANAIFVLVVLIILNGLARAAKKSWTLSQAELLAIYSMAAIASALAGHDMVPILVGMLPHAYWFATKENQYLSLFGQYLPKDLVVSDRNVITPFYTGNASFYHLKYLQAWIVPILWWSSFIFALLIVLLLLSIIWRNMWVDRERLTFPILELPLQITNPESRIWRSHLLWAGILIAGGIDLNNGLHFFYPNIPTLNVKHDYDMASHITMKPWNAISWMPISFYPFAIGLGYLLPVDLLFSCWFFYLFFKFQMVLASANAWDTVGAPFIREQGYGAYMAVAMIMIYNGRYYIRDVTRRAFGLPSEIDDSSEGLTYRTCFILISLAFCYTIWFIVYKLGLALHIAIVALGLYFVISLVVARIRAELGPPVHDQHFSGPATMMTQSFGTASFSHQDLTAINWFGWFNRAYRSHPMPVLAEGLKAGSSTNSSQKRFTQLMIFALFFGTLSAFWAYLHCAYQYGATSKMEYKVWLSAEQFDRLAAWINSPTHPNMQANAAIGAGFIMALILGILRSRFFDLPFHPIGFAISGSWSMNLVWFPLFMAWVAKGTILHYGGLRAYRNFLPFFLGLILGQYIMGCLWSLIGMIIGQPTYQFWGA